MSPTAASLQRDDSVSLHVDIAPLPVVHPTAPTGGGPSPAGDTAQGWLAVTGAEPAWLLVGGAVIVVALGIVLLRSRRGRR